MKTRRMTWGYYMLDVDLAKTLHYNEQLKKDLVMTISFAFNVGSARDTYVPTGRLSLSLR